MTSIEFSTAEKEAIAVKIKRYFVEELDHQIGQFEAEFLLDFFAKEIGAYYYNRGLYDAQQVLEERLDSIKEAIYDIEKPIALS